MGEKHSFIGVKSTICIDLTFAARPMQVMRIANTRPAPIPTMKGISLIVFPPFVEATTIAMKVTRPTSMYQRPYSDPPLYIIQLPAVPERERPMIARIGPMITWGRSFLIQPEPTSLIIRASTA